MNFIKTKNKLFGFISVGIMTIGGFTAFFDTHYNTLICFFIGLIELLFIALNLKDLVLCLNFFMFLCVFSSVGEYGLGISEFIVFIGSIMTFFYGLISSAKEDEKKEKRKNRQENWTNDKYNALKTLNSLKEKKVISKEEFEKEKKKILGGDD